MENTIVLEHVDKFYGKKQALSDINLTIHQGMFGLLGRNGAGKTTLMKTLATLHAKQNGKITVCGVPIERAREIRAMTGYLPQDFSLYPNMTVVESLDYLGVLSGMKQAERRARIDLLLKKVNLKEQRNKRVKALSGGMKRRLGIAQALLHEPKVLIVDEPTAGLDPEERIRFRNLLCEVAEERIVLLSTHIVGDIEATCEDIAIMNEGRVLWQGTVSRLLQEAEGKVYTLNVKKSQVQQLKKQCLVTGMVTQGDEVTVRLVAERAEEVLKALEEGMGGKASKPQTADIKLTPPNVEDAYMYCLYRNGCDVNGGEQ